jgi:hypothetical protein
LDAKSVATGIKLLGNVAETMQRAIVGVIVLLLAKGWMLLAVYCSAHQIIRVSTEQMHVMLALGSMGLGLALMLTSTPTQKRCVLWTIRLVTAFLALVLLRTGGSPDRMFVRWKMKIIPQSQWQQMAAELETLARDNLAKGSQDGIPFRSLPASFEQLSKTECKGGKVECDAKGEYRGAIVFCGSHYRRYDFVTGTEPFLEGWRGAHLRYFPVSTNAYLVISHD